MTSHEREIATSHKPKIVFEDGMWCCMSSDSSSISCGYGASPKEAFLDWYYFVNEELPNLLTLLLTTEPK